MARNMHRYEELTPYEFEREKERASIIYVSAGPLEYHEECNILGLIPTRVTTGVLRRLSSPAVSCSPCFRLLRAVRFLL